MFPQTLLTAAFDQLAEAVAIVDTAGIIQYINQAFVVISGYSREQAVGQNIAALQRGGPAAQPVHAQVRAALERGETWRGRLSARSRQGVPLELEVSIAPVRTADGRTASYVALIRDAAREAELERQLLHAQKMEAIGTLAAGIAHDFNNVLTAIFGYADLGMSTLPSGHPAIESLSMIEQASRQAGAVVKSLLTFSSKTVTERAVIDLGQAIDESAHMLRHMLPASIEIIRNIEPQVWVLANVTQIQQVLMNLAVNARDAMTGGGRLGITVRREPGPDGGTSPGAGPAREYRALLIVEDTGAGMTDEVRQRSFEPFFTTKSRGQGSGLGLSIIHGIVTDHQGQVEIRSAPGAGTHVTVSLPGRPAPQGVRGADSDAGRRRWSGLIIVSAGDAHLRSIVTSTLRAHGYQVLPAADSGEAWEARRARGKTVRAAVLDLDAEPGGGAACLQRLRDAGDDLPVIVLSGAGQVDEPGIAVRGNERLLRKPFPISQLVAMVDEATGAAVAQEAVP